jgi:hypothetical protein
VIEKRGALEALERILNRGGNSEDVLQEIVRVLHGHYARVAIRIVRDDELAPGPMAGNPLGTASIWPVYLQERKVGKIEAAPASEEDDSFMRRVATISAPYFL